MDRAAIQRAEMASITGDERLTAIMDRGRKHRPVLHWQRKGCFEAPIVSQRADVRASDHSVEGREPPGSLQLEIAASPRDDEWIDPALVAG